MYLRSLGEEFGITKSKSRAGLGNLERGTGRFRQVDVGFVDRTLPTWWTWDVIRRILVLQQRTVFGRQSEDPRTPRDVAAFFS